MTTLNPSNHPLNWTAFFKDDPEPPFVLDPRHPEQFAAGCAALRTLPFLTGLAVIVASVPTFAHRQWLLLHDTLADQRQQRPVDLWLLIGAAMREYLSDVEHLLLLDVEQAICRAQDWLNAQDEIAQFAFAACLYAHSRTSLRARMIFRYLLETGDADTRQMTQMRDFYLHLTTRQQEVALLTADGLTNQEIADTLTLESSAVADHLTAIFGKFQERLPDTPDRHGTRYRLIHWLTRLFIHYPELRL